MKAVGPSPGLVFPGFQFDREGLRPVSSGHRPIQVGLCDWSQKRLRVTRGGWVSSSAQSSRSRSSLTP